MRLDYTCGSHNITVPVSIVHGSNVKVCKIVLPNATCYGITKPISLHMATIPVVKVTMSTLEINVGGVLSPDCLTYLVAVMINCKEKLILTMHRDVSICPNFFSFPNSSGHVVDRVFESSVVAKNIVVPMTTHVSANILSVFKTFETKQIAFADSGKA